ncbi:MAG: DUF3084 domain-containing protein, partial [Prochlorococcus sp.]|nr:DUF3084 domain-containing protein [Prochlorococcus sp.]
MTGWPLILVLLVLGGILATLGDRLGSRIGKARLTLFNLRPRSTAVVITVLTGSLISALSLGLLLLVSRELRIGLFELKDLQSKLQNSRDDLEASRSAQVDVADELKTVQRQSKALRQEVAPLQRQRQRLEAERDRLAQDISSKDADIRRTGIELSRVRSQISAGEKELKQLESKLIALRRGDVVLSSG